MRRTAKCEHCHRPGHDGTVVRDNGNCNNCGKKIRDDISMVLTRSCGMGTVHWDWGTSSFLTIDCNMWPGKNQHGWRAFEEAMIHSFLATVPGLVIIDTEVSNDPVTPTEFLAYGRPLYPGVMEMTGVPTEHQKAVAHDTDTFTAAMRTIIEKRDTK
jgi:hypothetical protein